MNLSIDTIASVWDTLKDISLDPSQKIYLYGTGDGADKILAVMKERCIDPDGIFVSPEFYRAQEFSGFTCTTAEHLEAQGENFVGVVCFGSHLPELMDRILALYQKHPMLIPDVPVVGTTLFDRAFAQKSLPLMQEAYDLFDDETSRRVFKNVIDFKLSGRIEPLLESASPKSEVFSSLIPLTDEEDYLDLGAYTGDTVKEFLDNTPSGSFRSIRAFEPEPHSFKKLSAATEGLSSSSGSVVQLFNGCASDETGTMTMQTGRGRGSKKQRAKKQHTSIVKTYRLDDLDLPVSYLKIDVEGMEKRALLGMKQTLQTRRPKLNIAVYHRTEDFFELPLLLSKLLPNYRFFLRRHPCFPCWELNLYGIPNEAVQ